MTFRSKILLLPVITLFTFTPALAQEAAQAPATSPPVAVAAVPSIQDADFPQRYEIAKELHVIWQTELQVKEGIIEESEEITDVEERKKFLAHMNKDLDIKKIQEIASIAMAENFSLYEMQAMKVYFTSPLGRSAETKRRIIESKIRPDIKSVVDASLYKYQAELQHRIENDPKMKKMYPNGLPTVPTSPVKP